MVNVYLAAFVRVVLGLACVGAGLVVVAALMMGPAWVMPSLMVPVALAFLYKFELDNIRQKRAGK